MYASTCVACRSCDMSGFFDMSCSALTASWFWIIACMLGWKTINRLHLANDHMKTVVLTGSMRNIVPSC